VNGVEFGYIRMPTCDDAAHETLPAIDRALEALASPRASAATEEQAERWTGLMAGFAPAPTDRTTTNSGDTGGPI
jgi:hypothetical protein